ncbi:hypothetical protein KVR01_012415 [Diaporthe batatas]|uniref:uncharacterized protein n=1 Tax=Diaporthe batatas TaxID=748121 RepID=UPI001D037BB4|nr:uncharacterized protein KVR01_012415 [Diaporthe batatas]KAG8157753.1 hypothetical protein KVR01_012415 [Diaporthe batatas]
MSSPQRLSQLPVQSRKRKHCEISTLKNDRPTKRRRCVPGEETNLWTTVKRYLRDPAGRPAPSVSCPICAYPIAIRGIPTQEPDPWELADGSQKVGVVLPCAHCLCQECFNGHSAAQDELNRDKDKTCPICRASLLFIGCLHPIPPQRLPVTTGEDYSMVPLTIPELHPHEHRFAEDCWDCTTDSCEEYIDISMRFTAGNLYGVEYPVGEGPLQWQEHVERHQVLMWDYLSSLRSMPNWRNGSVPTGLLGVTFAEDSDVPVHILDGFVSFDDDAIVHSPTGREFWWIPVHRSQRPH